jgi:hypothetical protein
MCITARKIQKFFLNIFLEDPTPFTQHLANSGKGGGLLCEAGFSGLHAGPGDGAVLKNG